MVRRTLHAALISASIGIAILISACGDEDGDPASDTFPSETATAVPTASPISETPTVKILDPTGLSDSTDGNTDNANEESETTTTYVVVAGDTLSRIAEEFDTSVDALIEENNLPDTMIFVGQEISIPAPNTTISVEETATATPNADGETYVVKAGDTAFGIAIEFDITLEALAAANGISIDELSNIQVNQELLIPNQ